jgi:hypothetical protein
MYFIQVLSYYHIDDKGLLSSAHRDFLCPDEEGGLKT